MADPPWLGALERARSISSAEDTVVEARGLAYRELNARLACVWVRHSPYARSRTTVHR